jgi:hypothetical protein
MKEVYENSSEVIEYKVELLFTGFFSYFEAPFSFSFIFVWGANGSFFLREGLSLWVDSISKDHNLSSFHFISFFFQFANKTGFFLYWFLCF